jgi:putative transposase
MTSRQEISDPTISRRDVGTASPPSRRRHTPEEIVRKLREADALLGQGVQIAVVVDHIGVSEATFHRWRTHYGGIKADDARRLQELERENKDLKNIVANQCLDIMMLRQLTQEKLLSPELRSSAVTVLRNGFGVSERRACEVVGQPRSSQRRASGE